MSDRDLRVTMRCRVMDLHLNRDSPGRATEHLHVHKMVEAFVERRSQLPVGGETFQCATRVTGVTIYTLHSGDDRGATWHDVDDDEELPHDIVWLLGVKPSHGYEALCDVAEDGELLPDSDDYQQFLDDNAYDLARALVEEVPQARSLANASPGAVHEVLLGGRIKVRLYRDPDASAPLLTIAIQTYPMPGILELESDWFERTVAAFFPKDANSIDVARSLGPYELDQEVAFCGFPED